MRDMFSAECGDYLTRLTEGFLALEHTPGDAAVVDRLFRVAHSLKGTARIMDCTDLHRAAHCLEDLLVLLRDGQLLPDPQQFDALSGAMDLFQTLLQATLDEGDTRTPADHILAIVKASRGAPPSAYEGAVPASTAAEPAAPSLAPPGVEPAGPTPPRPPAALPPLALEVLKVPVAKLDVLINQVGELLVTRQTWSGHVETAQALSELLEEASRRAGPDRQGWAQLAQKAQYLAQGLAGEDARMSRLLDAMEAGLHRTRMVPLSVLLDQAPKWVRDAGRALGKSVRLEMRGADLELDKHMVECLRDPLMHLFRNAVDHGIETPARRALQGKPEQGLLTLTARMEGHGLSLVLADDGAGLDFAAIRRAAERRDLPGLAQATVEDLARLLLRPGFTTREQATEFSGRGVGLDVVASQVTALKGTIALHSTPGLGTEVRLWLPQSLSRSRVLMVQASGLGLGLPSACVRGCLKPAPTDFQTLEGRPVVIVQAQVIPQVPLGALLGRAGAEGNPGYVVLLEAGGEQVALGVDDLLGEAEVLHKPMPPRLQGLAFINGFSLLGNGHIVMLAEAQALAAIAREAWLGAVAQTGNQAQVTRVRSVLLADDSLTTRVQLRRILEAAGYKVQPAVDGLDAWARLGKQPFDAVVSDVQMPGLDGVQLTARIRANPALTNLPVILVTTLASEEDQRRGLDAGASAYITKGSFDQEQLLDQLRRLT